MAYAVAIAWLSKGWIVFRYFLPALPFFFIAAGIALSLICRSLATGSRMKLRAYPTMVLLLVFWVGAFALPFIYQLWTNPPAARLPEGDWRDYTARDSSGFGIPDLAAELMDLAIDKPTYAVGAFAGCETLRLYLPRDSNVTLDCPNVLSGERRANYLNVYLPKVADERGPFLLVLENKGLVLQDDLTTVELTPVSEIARPGGVIVIQLFVVEAKK